MKRLFFLAAVICCSQLVSAQTRDTIPKRTDTTTNKMKHEDKGAYITMQAGQVMLVKDNNAVKIEKDEILKDGTVVTTTGKVKKTDGTELQMKEGDRVYLEGGMKMGNKDKDKDPM